MLFIGVADPVSDRIADYRTQRGGSEDRRTGANLRWSCLTSHHRLILRKSMRQLNHAMPAPGLPCFFNAIGGPLFPLRCCPPYVGFWLEGTKAIAPPSTRPAAPILKATKRPISARVLATLPRHGAALGRRRGDHHPSTRAEKAKGRWELTLG